MSLTSEIDKIRETIKEVEDPAVATALRHVCKALDEIQEENQGTAAGPQERSEKAAH